MIGILGLGMYAPPDVRTNRAWKDVAESWPRRQLPPLPAQATEGMRRVHEATSALANDPFQGVVERRVLRPQDRVVTMEELAAREAIMRAGIAASDIDLLLTHPMVPEYELANTACELHERLHLSRTCLSTQVEATAYTVFAQLALAEAMLAAGRARYALLVQSCAGSRVVEQTHPLSVLLGDAATAIVLGPTALRGLLALVHYTDGRFPRSLVRQAGKLIVDPQQLWDAQLTSVDACTEASRAAMRSAGISDVDFLAIFQGTAWLHDTIAAHLGATRAKSVDVFQRFGYLSAAAVTATLYIGERAGRLVADDLVLLTGGGTGQTYGAAVLRW